MATACGSCHIGGGLVESGRDGVRYPQRAMPDFMNDSTPYNAYDFYVQEYWTESGQPAHYVNDQCMNSHMNSDMTLVVAGQTGTDMFGNSCTTVVPDDANPASLGFQPAMAPWKYPYANKLPALFQGMLLTNTGAATDFMMPNVREMDCLFCHMEGYNNVISSVAVQMGALNAAPSMGAGLLNMFTQTYMPNMISLGPEMMVPDGSGGYVATGYYPAMLAGSVVNNIKPNPPTDNCRLCHSPKTMNNFSDMFDKFLAASPMSFEPGNPMAAFTGLVMPAYDLNAPFLAPGSASPIVYPGPAQMGQTGSNWVYGDGTSADGPFNGMFPMALFESYRSFGLDSTMYQMGGNNAGMTGPIYFAGGDTGDQSALKKAIVPFPRADFFKRGDLWDDASKEAHYSLQCSGCHFDTNTGDKDKNQCDPGRGFARLGGVESGAAWTADANGVTIDSRNTVKRCENCHITGKNAVGKVIDTFGAPDPTRKHAEAGLTANIVTGAYGYNSATGTIGTFTGNHLDVVDCTVCHMYKESMAVRALDCTSGNRYPTMIGFLDQYGMMAMFGAPMGDEGPQFPQQHWDPLHGWWSNSATTLDDGSVNPDFRRKIYNMNMITAVLWDNDGAFDANGDLANGDTSGLGASGFDPWVQRDLKAGMNFADTGFAPVPIGFGQPGVDPYGTAYDQNGLFTGAWDYVGVYGGNVIFTTPEQITAYKTFRSNIATANDITDSNGNVRTWDDTKLIYFGGPFQVTHNIVGTAKFALGKGGNCNMCHDANAGFFTGEYDMTGSGMSAAASVDQSDNLMSRGLEDIEVVAAIDDLVTGAEGQNKAGATMDVEFEEEGCWNSTTKTFTVLGDGTCTTATHKRTKDMDRSEFLYNDVREDDIANGTNEYANLIAELTTNRTKADYGIDVNPVAAIATIDGKDSTIVGFGNVTTGSSVALVANEAVQTAAGNFKYYWYVNDGLGINGTTGGATYFEGTSINHVFAKKGTWTVTLKVIDEEGHVAQTYQKVNVAAATSTIGVAIGNDAGAANTSTIDITGLPATTDTLYILWGDGSKEKVDVTVGSTSISVDHVFSDNSQFEISSGVYKYKLSAYAFEGTSRLMSKGVEIVLDGVN